MYYNEIMFYYFACFTILTAYIDHGLLLNGFNKSWKFKLKSRTSSYANKVVVGALLVVQTNVRLVPSRTVGASYNMCEMF